MARNLSSLKLKNVVSDSDNSSDHENENDTGDDLDLPLEKLNLGPKKKLLVLNLGGLLVDRVHRRNESAVRRHTPDVVHGNFLVFQRPFCGQFMKFCLESFEVGIWSSAMDRNVDPVLDNILSGLRRKLVFVWDQGKCIESDYPSLEKKSKPIFLKQLKQIWENKRQLPVPGGRFSEYNTLLIDDEPHASLLNPPNTGVFPRTYKVRDGGDTFLGPEGELQKFLKGLADADDVPTYVKEHPIGQPAITASHPDWDYYANVIREVEAPDDRYSDYYSDYD